MQMNDGAHVRRAIPGHEAAVQHGPGAIELCGQQMLVRQFVLPQHVDRLVADRLNGRPRPRVDGVGCVDRRRLVYDHLLARSGGQSAVARQSYGP